ncbi:MAP kinase kinase-like protein [Reticulomyxa filosa]|uniref:MAP kinase kinase-like protein n=1 Tax=Reticulomyxa filosa TaxID=46433 RepID=X6NEW4_RETFI|nr:MAP kinase kinase-like protein [Reticulomyxa filosa]|eukprot:ETO24428.1 MAP kinase kinase-like protein [Reticulomyxa filosa]
MKRGLSFARNFSNFPPTTPSLTHFGRSLFNLAKVLVFVSLKWTLFKKESLTNKKEPKAAPKSGSTHLYLLKEGNRNLSRGNALQSINDFTQAIEIESTSEGYSKRAFVQLHIKDYHNAMTDALKAIELNPRNIEGHLVMGMIQVALNEYEKALESFGTAIDLTSPLDFRRDSIEETINGCKASLKMQLNGAGQTTPTDFQKKLTEKNVTEPVIRDTASNIQPAGSPFANKEFIDLQTDITKQMVDLGGEEFSKKLMKLNQSPAVQKLGQKALKGEQPTYADYMELMKDEHFRRYQAALNEISKQPKFSKISSKFAQMDWMGAYNELKQDPEALQLYMRAFDCFDESPNTKSPAQQ